jgi:5-formyltetrahydrofolate cyclo-ligase
METSRLRQEMRDLRRQLSPQTLKQHSQKLLRLACNYKPFRQGNRIAFYLASRGEIDPSPLLSTALRAGKHAYLPILRKRPEGGLWFASYAAGDSLFSNRFGIWEPSLHHRTLIMPWSLDMVFVPLVAFDETGNRLGMGGGYYDRTFAFKQQRRHWKGPRLIGIAHDFQRVHGLSKKPWDIPLDAVITEQRIYVFDQPDATSQS